MKKAVKEELPLTATRTKRYFSEPVRREIVAEIDAGLSKAEASRKYEVTSSAIYKWMSRYSKTWKKSLVTVVESVSATHKVKELQTELEAAYALLGRSKAETMLLYAILEEASEELGIDLKKNIETRHSCALMARQKQSKKA